MVTLQLDLTNEEAADLVAHAAKVRTDATKKMARADADVPAETVRVYNLLGKLTGPTGLVGHVQRNAKAARS